MQPVALEPTRLRWSGDPATYRSGVGGSQAGQRGDLPPVANIVPVTLFAQRGAAAAEGSQRDKCVRSKLGALSRRAESGDFVAQWGGEMQKSDQRPNNSKPKVTKNLLICSFSAHHPVLCSKGRTLVTS